MTTFTSGWKTFEVFTMRDTTEVFAHIWLAHQENNARHYATLRWLEKANMPFRQKLAILRSEEERHTARIADIGREAQQLRKGGKITPWIPNITSPLDDPIFDGH